MSRLMGAVFSGLVVGAICIAILQGVSHAMYPPPEDMDWNDKSAVREYIAELPPQALGIVLLSYVVGSAMGGFLAGVISITSRTTAVATVGVLFLISGVINVISIPHPLWFVVASLIVFVPAALVGGKLGIQAVPREPPPDTPGPRNDKSDGQPDSKAFSERTT